MNRRMRRTALAIVAAVAGALAIAPAANADLGIEGPDAVFNHCPIGADVGSDVPLGGPGAGTCIVIVTESGEVRIGNTVQEITKPITVQAGFNSGTGVTVRPTDGTPVLSAAGAEAVPGGLTGIELPVPNDPIQAALVRQVNRLLASGPLGVTALTQGAGDPDLASLATATLPMKIKLGNPLLGNRCYLGSDANPITLELTNDLSEAMFEPLGGETGGAKISPVTSTDDAFTVPRSSGCGGALLAPIVGGLVDTQLGLPSPSGSNGAELINSVYLVGARELVEAYDIPLP